MTKMPDPIFKSLSPTFRMVLCSLCFIGLYSGFCASFDLVSVRKGSKVVHWAFGFHFDSKPCSIQTKDFSLCFCISLADSLRCFGQISLRCFEGFCRHPPLPPPLQSSLQTSVWPATAPPCSSALLRSFPNRWATVAPSPPSPRSWTVVRIPAHSDYFLGLSCLK